MYGEDLEWCWRARQRGWTLRFDPSAVVRHVGNASGVQNYGRRRSTAYWRNTYRAYRERRGLASATAFRGINLAAAGAFNFPVQISGDESSLRSEWNAPRRRKQSLLIRNLFRRTRSAPPFEDNQGTEEHSFAFLYQLAQSRLRTLWAGECVYQNRTVEVDHSTRARRPPVRRAARISAISESTSA